MTQTNWPAPIAPPTHQPTFRWTPGRLVLVACVAVAVGLAAVSATTGTDTPAAPSGGTKYYAAAGWTASRAGDLSVKIQRDDGVSKSRADCSMKQIIEGMTWLEWQSAGTAGQFSLIREAEANC